MRTCSDCGTDISARHSIAYLCTACSRVRRLARKSAYYRALPDILRLGRHDQPDRASQRRRVAA